MTMKRILIVTHCLRGGGVEVSLSNLLKSLDLSHCKVTLYSLVQEKPLSDLPPFIRYRFFYRRGFDGDAYIKRLITKVWNKFVYTLQMHFSPKWFYRILVRGTWDVEIAYIEGDSTRIVSGSTNRRSKKLAWIHCDMQTHHWSAESYRNGFEELDAYGKFDIVCAVSERIREIALRVFPSIRQCVHVPNYIPKIEVPEKLETRKSDRVLRFCAVGRLEYIKGFDRLIDATATLHNMGYDFHLQIIGDGKERCNLEKKVAACFGLSNKVAFLGYKKDPYPYMKMADWLICPSRSEGYGLVLAEAMYVGTPVITTDCSGTREITQDGKFGLLVDNNTDALTSALLRIIKDVSLYSFYKDKASEWTKLNDSNKTLKFISELIYGN